MKKMFTMGFAFSAMFIALMAANDTKAQSSNSSSNSNSAAGAASQSGSAAIISTTTNNNVPANTTNTSNGTFTNNTNERVSGGTNSTLTQQGHTTSDVTVRTTPTVYAPPVSGGNPCTLALSVGGSFIGWGAAAGGTFVDKDCADRQKIAMIHNAGYQQAARELMCNDKESYVAFRYTSTPCAPRAAWDPPGTPAPQAQPMPQQLAPPVVTSAVVLDRSNLPRCSRTITDNCWSP